MQPQDTPARVQVGDAAYLKIVGVKDAGAFLDWGQPKDLLLPWAEVPWEDKKQIVEGRKVLVYIFKHEDGRAAASLRLNAFIKDQAETYKEGDEVDILVSHPTELGMRVIVDNRYWGLIHHSDLFEALRKGEQRKAYVKALRFDRKLDLTLLKAGYAKVEGVAEKLLKTLQKRGGFIPVNDKSDPQVIYEAFGISKKVFKQSIGALYRERKILIEQDGIRLITEKKD